MNGIDWKFNLNAKPYWLFAPAAFFVVALIFGAGKVEERAGVIPSGVPIVGAVDSEVREVLVTPAPTPIQVITEGPPTSRPATPTQSPLTTTDSPSDITVEAPILTSTVVVEAVDLDPILAAIEGLNIEVVQEGVDIEAILAAIEAGFKDIVIEITVDGTTEIVCDTRGQGCEEPPFGNKSP